MSALLDAIEKDNGEYLLQIVDKLEDRIDDIRIEIGYPDLDSDDLLKDKFENIKKLIKEFEEYIEIQK